MIWLLACSSTPGDGNGTEPDAGDGTDSGDPTEPVHSGAADSTAPPDDTAVPSHTGGATTTNTVFVAQGDKGRIAVSCDGGRTWPFDGSDDDTFRCFVDGDCDHDPGAGRGIVFAEGVFVATFGWGFPGAVRRLGPQDSAFVDVLTGHTFAGVGHDGATFVAADRPPYWSDDGVTWQAGADFDSDQWNPRRTGGGDGVSLVVLESGQSDLNRSLDGGATWTPVNSWPPQCGAAIQWEGGIVVRPGLAVVVGADGAACWSTDDGFEWSLGHLGGDVTSRLLATPAGFETWGSAGYGRVRYTSTDGEHWTTEATSMSGGAAPEIGAVARASDGTYVAVNGGWDQWYERQRFYRSTDGLVWEELASSTFTGSHPIRFIAAGDSSTPLCR